MRKRKPDKMTALAEIRERHRAAPRRTLDFFRTLDLDAIAPALEEARSIADLDVRDSVYRIFHQSWKMYYLGDDAAELGRLMLAPLTTKTAKRAATPTSLVNTMRRWHLDPLFVEVFERMASTKWSEKRNDPDAWRDDATRLTSGFTIVREVALASLETMDRLRKHEGFLFHQNDPLDPTDALFLEVWTGVGAGLRYFRPEGLEDRCRAILASANRGPSS